MCVMWILYKIWLFQRIWLCQADIMVPQCHCTWVSLKRSEVCSMCNWTFATVSFWSSRKPHASQMSLVSSKPGTPSTLQYAQVWWLGWVLCGALASFLDGWDYYSLLERFCLQYIYWYCQLRALQNINLVLYSPKGWAEPSFCEHFQ